MTVLLLLLQTARENFNVSLSYTATGSCKSVSKERVCEDLGNATLEGGRQGGSLELCFALCIASS